MFLRLVVISIYVVSLAPFPANSATLIYITVITSRWRALHWLNEMRPCLLQQKACFDQKLSDTIFYSV